MHSDMGSDICCMLVVLYRARNVEALIMAFDLLAARVISDLHIVLTGGVGDNSKEVLEQIETSPFKGTHSSGWLGK